MFKDIPAGSPPVITLIDDESPVHQSLMDSFLLLIQPFYLVIGICYLVMGCMYSFNGKKSYHLLHHVVCCLFGIAFFGFLAKEISDNELIGAAVGLIAGCLSIWGCLLAKTLKDFILSVMLGKFVVEFLYTYLFTWWIESPSTFYEVIKNVGIIYTIIYSCLCTPDIKITTSIVGGGFIYNAFCMTFVSLF